MIVTRSKIKLCTALKEQLKSKSLEEVTVCSICKQSGVNRKTFYNNFEDKYDLACFNFLNELSQMLSQKEKTFFEFFRVNLLYFEQNKNVYRRLFTVQGQNSFYEFYNQYIKDNIILYSPFDLKEKNFELNFYTDAILIALLRWIKNDCIPTANEFCTLLQGCLKLN